MGDTMTRCEKFEMCSYFRDRDNIPFHTLKMWHETFCSDAEKSNECERLIHFKNKGEPAPLDLSPIGPMKL